MLQEDRQLDPMARIPAFLAACITRIRQPRSLRYVLNKYYYLNLIYFCV